MEDTGKKKILLIIGLILFVISIIAIILSLTKPTGNSGGGGGTSQPETPPVTPSIQKEITELKDEAKFFGIQNILTNYYDNLAKSNRFALYNSLEKNYISDNGITKNNVISKLESVYDSVTFIAKSIYFNDNSSITYYFVNGYLYTSTMDEEKFDYKKNINYLVIVDKNKEYVIKPLDNDIAILDYAKNYNKVEEDFNNNIYYQTEKISEKNKLVLYINEFLKLLFYDTERAYNMLTEETKSKYINYSDFQNQILNIYNNISTNIFGYASEKKDGYIKYEVADNKQRNITIIENKVMDYQIGY